MVEYEHRQPAAGLGPDSVAIIDGRVRYVVPRNGHGYRSAWPEDDRAFRLPLRAESFLERAYYFTFECEPLIAFAYGDGVSGASRVVRFERGSMTTHWVSESLSFNLGPGLASGATVYLTAAGTVAALDLHTGAFKWKHNGLRHQAGHIIAYFQRPELQDDYVIFRGGRERPATVDPADEVDVVIIVHRDTGDLVSTR